MAVHDEATVWLDSMIERLLSVRHKNPRTQVNLEEEDILNLLSKARSLFLEQPALLELHAPINVCGDTHGT